MKTLSIRAFRVGALAALLLLTTMSAHATFPGQNGQITYVHFTRDGDEHVFVANPDGSNERQLFAMTSEGSDWSADGSRIAFEIGRAHV